MTAPYEMNFCRRCGAKLTHVTGNVYKCDNGHTIFYNSSAALTVLLTNSNKEVLTLVRALDPGKGTLDLPGGFADLGESLEDALVREIEEETGLKPTDYTPLKYVMSDIDPYEYDLVVTVVLTVVFRAEMVTDAQPTPADDAAETRFMPLKDVVLSDVFFPTARASLAWAKDNL